MKHLMPFLAKFFYQPTNKPKPKKKPRKKPCIENKAKYNDSIKFEALDENLINTQLQIISKSFYDLIK